MTADPLLPAAAEPADELLRRALGMQADGEFDAVTAAAAQLLDCPIALVSLVCHDRLWFKSRYGLDLDGAQLQHSFCSHTIRLGAPLIVPDLAADDAFRSNPFVSCESGVRFYAGIPLMIRFAPDRPPVAVGSFCVIAREPRTLSAEQLAMLRQLARVVRALIEARVLAATATDHAVDLAAVLALRDRMQRQFRQAERMASIGWWRLTLADRRVEWSEEIYAIHDLPAGGPVMLEEAVRFFPDADRAVIEQCVARAVATGQPYDVEVDFVTARGRRKRVRAMGEVEREDGAAVALFGVFQDVTERYRLQQALERRANFDELTRIASRGHFNRVLDEEVARTQAANGTLTLVLIDLDRFKEANDRFGHAAGDEVLRRAAEALQAEWLEGSFAARLGGDEFVLLLTAPALAGDMDAVLSRLLRDLTQAVGRGEEAITVTATLGACRLAGGNDCRRRLLERADQALYAAKRTRRGTAAMAGDIGVILADGTRLLPDIRLVG